MGMTSPLLIPILYYIIYEANKNSTVQQTYSNLHSFLKGKGHSAPNSIILRYYNRVSYVMIVVYSRNHKGVGMAHKIISPKKQPQFLLTTIRQYWLGETKPKQAFRLTRNAFNKLLQNFKNNLFNGIFY